MNEVETALEFLNRINRRDVDKLAELMTEDHVFVDSLGRQIQGREEMRSGWRGYYRMCPDYWVSHEEVFRNGSTVALFGAAGGTVSASGKLPAENMWRTRAAWLAVVEKGLVKEWRVSPSTTFWQNQRNRLRAQSAPLGLLLVKRVTKGGAVMMHSSQVPISQSALLVVDAQDSFMASPRWERRNNHEFEKNVGTLIDGYRKAGLPVIFFLHTDEDEGFEPDSPHLKLMDFIVRRQDEPLIQKNTRNCFTSTGLGALLLEKGIRRVAITGIQMEQCCETTARVAADLGYAVDFVSDGTMTFPIPNHDVPGEELGVEEIKTRTEYALRKRFARIASVAMLTAELAALKR